MRNSDVLAFINNVLETLNAETITALENPTNKLKKIYAEISNSYKRELGSSITADLKTLDDFRDSAIKGLENVITGFLFHYEGEKQQSADDLTRSITKYGKHIHRLTYQEKTTVLRNLMQEWQNDELHNALKVLNLVEWADRLNAANEEFDKMYIARTVEQFNKKNTASSTTLRKPLEAEYINLTDYIKAVSLLTPSEQITAVIGKINALVEKYNLESQRRGSRTTTDKD
jgi:ribosomal protein S17E